MEEAETHPSENTYPTSSLAELNRLQEQDTYVNQHTLLRPATPTQPGLALLPPSFQPQPDAIILDVGCGSGGWVLEVALACPQIHVVGLDNDPKMVAFATNQMIALHVPNAEFLLGDMMDLTASIELESVSLLHARYIEWFVKDYAAALKQWLCVLKQGGMLCLTESEGPLTNSNPYNTIQRIFFETLEKTHGKSRIDEEHQGKTLFMRRWLQDLGLRDIQEVAHIVNFSAGIPERESPARSNSYGMESMKAFIVQGSQVSPEEYDQLVAEATNDLWSEKFRGIQYLLTVTGSKE